MQGGWAETRKQQTQADSLGSLRPSGSPVTLSLQAVKDDQFIRPRSQSRSQTVVPLRCPFVCCSNAAATTPHDFDEFSWLADKTNSLPISDRQKKNFVKIMTAANKRESKKKRKKYFSPKPNGEFL
jgi:hypothetical protein